MKHTQYTMLEIPEIQVMLAVAAISFSLLWLMHTLRKVLLSSRPHLDIFLKVEYGHSPEYEDIFKNNQKEANNEVTFLTITLCNNGETPLKIKKFMVNDQSEDWPNTSPWDKIFQQVKRLYRQQRPIMEHQEQNLDRQIVEIGQA